MNSLRPFVAILASLLVFVALPTAVQADPSQGAVAGVPATVPAKAVPAKAVPAKAVPAKAVPAVEKNSGIWLEDYGTAKTISKEKNKMLVVWFYNPGSAQSNANFETNVLGDASVKKQLANMVAVKLPTNTKLLIDGRETSLISHAAFGELQGSPGIAMIDMTDGRMPYYGHVVSVYPFNRQFLSQGSLMAMLTLPSGTISQRTLTLAVRMHPEAPQSAYGTWHPILADQAERHSAYQASVHQLGHQNWDSRFQYINSALGGFPAKEVCAQSWAGQGLVSAAEDCVNSWRQSPGHWEGVRGAHSYFGYDMKRASDGIWYATGIFAGSH